MVLLLACFGMWSVKVEAADYYWDSDGSNAGNNIDGTNLGGTGSWNVLFSNWWPVPPNTLTPWGNTSSDRAIFTYAFPSVPYAIPTPFTVTVDSGIIANQLLFNRSGYTLSGGDLTIAGTAPGFYAQFGETATISSQILGTDGLTKMGGGSIRLTNALNSYTGAVNIAGGSIIINSEAALGGTGAVNITAGNGTSSNVLVLGLTGGSLVLDGSAGAFTFSRDLNLEGRGPAGQNGAALLSIGNNTLSGTINTAPSSQTPATFRNTRITSANGTLNLAGTLNVLGTAGTTVTTLGGGNQAGVGNYNLTGTLTGTGILEKTGGGTLFLNPADATGFTGRFRFGASAAVGQSSVRVSTANAFGNGVGAGTISPIDIRGSVLELRSDSSLDFGKNVYMQASSTLFASSAVGGTGVNQTMTFGTLHNEANLTATFNSRNGYGFTFGAFTMATSGNSSTITNNMGGILTFTGNVWNNSDGSDRTLTISGSGNTVIAGSINSSGAGIKTLAKTGVGNLTIEGVATTLNGPVTVAGGLTITDFRSLNNNSGTISLNGGALLIGTGVTATAAGLTTSKVINLSGTTGAASIYANQTGSNPIVFNSSFTATGAGTKTLTLGGSNTADNVINGAIVQNGSTLLTKVGSGTWVLAGTNAYTGVTTISNGTLKLKANAATSTVLSSANGITFGPTSVFSGGTLEFVGQNNVNNVQALGTLTVTQGANTIKLTPGIAGTASLAFTSVAAAAATLQSGLNIVGSNASNTVTLTGLATGLSRANFYFNGSNFAYSNAGVLRAPVYGTDATFVTAPGGAALPAGQNNFNITGDITAQGTQTTNTLRFDGARSLTLSGGSTLTVRTGAAGTHGGILATGGASSINGGTGLTTGGAGTLVFRVNGASDTLTVNSLLTSGTTGGLTKNGAGTLILTAANAQTGTIQINEGTIQLSGTGRLGAAADLVIRQGATLDLNGVTPSTVTNAFNSNGTVTNSSATAVTFTVGGTGASTGTSLGTINETNGVINVTKSGDGAQSWLGASNYTGVTTIGGSGLVTVDFLGNGGVDSGIGASTSDAANLVFSGTAASGLNYRGDISNGILTLGSRSTKTNRLFTVTGAGLTLSSTQTTNLNNAIIWSNVGTIVHGGTAQNRTFIFTGTSQGDNTFIPRITDPTGFATSVTKTGTGIWHLGAANNNYSGATLIQQGILGATNGAGLSSNSNLQFDGGTLYSQGTFTRNIGTAAGEMQFLAPAANTAQFSGGFLGGDSKLTVNWAGTPVWGLGAFLNTRDGLMLNGSQARGQGATGSIALSEVEIAGNFSLGTSTGTNLGPALTFTIAQNSPTVTVASTAGLQVGQSITGTNIPSGAYIVYISSATQFVMSASTANAGGIAGTYADGAITGGNLRAIRVDDNGNTGADFATISGIISAGDAATGIRKLGTGTLKLTGANTYTGETNVNQGFLEVLSLGRSGTSGATSVGDQLNANLNASAITLGNGGTGGASLQYIGAGEVSDRKIRLNSTTGSTQIHADGAGALILTNVANDMAAGVKTFFLRGTNNAGNMITSQLSDNGGALSVAIDSNATWILTNAANNYTGTTTVSAGALGIGHDTAIGGAILNSNGNIFAYGGDRTVSNTMTLNNNANWGFLGDFNLTFTNAVLGSSANSNILINSIVAGKALTFSGLTANALTATRNFTIDGPGETIINGNFTTSTAFGVQIIKTGDGTLTLGTNGGSSNWNQVGTGIDVDRGLLRFTTSNAIGSAAGNGGLTISPELVDNDTATVNLNGTTQTVTSLTSTSDGTVVIDNTAGGAASLTFGAGDAAVNFGTGAGNYTITDSGAGALSITKTGTGIATIGGGAGTTTLTYQGGTNVTGGTMNINAALNGTTSLSVTGAPTSILNLNGALSAPSAITTVTVDNGATLSFNNGSGTQLSNLSTFTLGTTGGATLGFELGASNALSDSFTASGVASASNTIVFNITGLTGFGSITTYDLLTAAATSNLSGATYAIGLAPGGYTYSFIETDTQVQLVLTAITPGDRWWRGDAATQSWSDVTGGNSNFSTDAGGTSEAGAAPSSATTVNFSATNAGGLAKSTTLDNAFSILGLNILNAVAGDVTIASGIGGTSSTLTIGTGGINVQTGAPALVTISAPVILGANQTWTVTDAATDLVVSGALSGAFNLEKAGAGELILSADNPSYSGITTISAGTLTIGAAGATGSIGTGDVVNNSALVFNRTGTFTVSNLISGSGSLTKNASGVMTLSNNNNSFTGAITINAGTLAFTTIGNVGGGNTAMGAPTTSGAGTINMTGGTLSFVGSSAQSTDRLITSATNAITLSANGATASDTITYNGAITIGPTADGSQLILSGTTGRRGNITGGFTQTGTTADVTANGGTWHLSGIQSTVGDDLVVSGLGTVLNLDATAVVRLMSGDTTSDLTIRSGGVVNINALNAVQYTGSNYRLFVGQGADGADAVLNLNANLESGRFILGERNTTRVGIVNGPGTLTVSDAGTTAIELYRGEINANLANSAAAATFNKHGSGTVTLRGDNSGLTHTAATIVNDGVLILDYTLNNAAKIRTGSALDMRGAELRILGNNSAATLQAVASFTMATGSGNSIIDMTAGTGQTATLDLKAITRAASAGTLRINLNNAGTAVITNTTNTNGIVGLSAYTTVKDSTGTWFGTNSTNLAGGSIVALASTLQNSVGAWANAAHITDGGAGFSGPFDFKHVNSLRYDAAGGSVLNAASQGSVLTIASGGILVTDQVTAGAPGIFGGTLGTGVTEIIVTHDSSRVFEISSRIGVNNAFTNSGSGTVLLSGKNAFTGTTSIQNGRLQLSGGNSLPDTGLVSFATNRNSILELLANENMGRLAGGQRNANSDYGQMIVNSHTLGLNVTTDSNFDGVLVGTGTIVKTGANFQGFRGISTGFTGDIVVNQGGIQFSVSGQINASSFTINKSGALEIANTSATSSTTRILDTTPIILNSADGAMTGTGAAARLGLTVRSDNNSNRVETIGNLVFNSGASYLSGDANVGTGDARAGIAALDFIRSNSATVAVRARNLGTTTTHNIQFRISNAGNQTAFISGLTGGGGGAGSATISIVPWAIGETHNNAALAVTNMGNSLVTYVSGAGFRPLNLSTEYATYATAGDTNNTRQTLTVDLTGQAGRTLNSLVIHNDNTVASAVNFTGTGVGQTITNTSGVFLFTLNPAAAASSAHSIILGGFDGGLLAPGGEYLFYVVNPSSASDTATLTTRIDSPLGSSADITKSGRGTLILTGINTAGGGTKKTTLNEGILEISDLDNIGGGTGILVFAGGTLRLGAGFADDLSTRAISYLLGGGTLDTNGIDLALANSLGSGDGGFTKTGLGNLTLNAAATYTGATVLTQGTITIGANLALGVGGDLTLAGGTTLALGTNSLIHGLVTTSGASPLITGTGTINATKGFVFNHTGDTSINAILGGAGGLFKLQANVITLTGLSTYTGTTEVRAGGLVFDSIGNVGGGASALGTPGTVEDGIIRMGLTTAATTLTYTGSGHLSNRLIGMQGTTGALSLFGNGTGAVGYGGARFETPGNKTLTLRGISDAALVNQIGALMEVGGVLTLNKTDANTWMVNGVSSYTGVTQIDDGTLMIGVDDALPTGTTVRLGTGATAGTLDLNGFDQTISSLLVQTNNNAVTNNLIVDTDKTLTINGAVTIGVNANESDTNFTASGGGSVVVNSGGADFQVGGATGNTNENRVDVDFTGLESFTANLGLGTFRLGDANTGTGNSTSTFKLAENNEITASIIRIGDGTGGGNVHTLTLGIGTNELNADTINVGSAGANIRSSGAVVFDAGDTTGSVTIRASDGTGRSTINMVNTTGNTGTDITSTIDLTGHTADILASTITMASRTLSANSATATFSFDQGILDVTTLNMASRTSTGTGGATATVNLGDSAAPGTPTVTIGAINMAVNTSAGGAVAANLNVTGGDVTIGTGSGTAINMANAGTGRTVTSNITLTGGNVDLTGDIIRTGGAGSENATVTLNGATLDMNGNDIGTGAAQITLAAQSGRLENLGELNGGAGLTKTTAGVLILEGTNTYTGNTVVSNGTLQLGSGAATGSMNTASAISVASGATFAVNQSDTVTQGTDFATAAITGDGNFAQTGTGTTVLTADNTYDGTTSVTAGTLIVNGDQSAANGNLNVAVGATLGGAGTIGGDAFIDGNLRTGLDTANGTTGTLIFADDLAAPQDVTFGDTSTWFIDLVQGTNSIESDSISVRALTIESGALLSFNTTNPFTQTEKFTIATYSPGLLTGQFTFGGVWNNLEQREIGGGFYQINYNDGNAITLTAVPEPGTFGLLGLALAGLAFLRFRKRRQEALAAVEGVEE